MRKLWIQVSCMLLAVMLVLCGCDNTPEASQTEPSTQSTDATDAIGQTNATDATETVPDPSDAPLEDIFTDSAFIGDSVTLKLRNYSMATGATGSAVYLCQGSYGVAHAVEDTMLLNFRGDEMTPQDALAACGAKRVFILLGMNDIALYGIDKTIENWGKLLENIRAKCPDIVIYIQSGTPIHKDGEVGSLTNENMDAYNVRLEAFAAEHGCHYIDIASQFKNSSNALAGAYCSDAFVHFTDLACKMWVGKLQECVTE